MELDAVKKAFDARRKADRSLEKALKKAFKFGATAYWDHGKQNRSAMVLEVSGDRIKVRGERSDYWICASRVTGVKPVTRRTHK